MMVVQRASERLDRITYIVADEERGVAMVIDPDEAQLEEERAILDGRGWRPILVAETGVESGQPSAGELYREIYGARIIASDRGPACADFIVRTGDRFVVGALEVEVEEGENGVSYGVGHRRFGGAGHATEAPTSGVRDVGSSRDASLARRLTPAGG